MENSPSQRISGESAEKTGDNGAVRTGLCSAGQSAAAITRLAIESTARRAI